MSSTCFALSSLPLRLFPLLGRTVPMRVSQSSAPAPYQSVYPHVLSIATSPRRDPFRSMASNAIDGEAGVAKSVPVSVAHELLKSGHCYLDVRTQEEFIDGHAVGAVNIPFMLNSNSGLSKNPKFMEEILSTFKKDGEIIIGCLSGKRSLMAASELSKNGFTAITDISGGYSAWVQNGLPTEK